MAILVKLFVCLVFFWVHAGPDVNAQAPSNLVQEGDAASSFGGTGDAAKDQLQLGDYILRMQSDCNLVFYGPDEEHKVLSFSATDGLGTACYASLGPDGEFAVYDRNRQDPEHKIWFTNTAGKGVRGRYVVEIKVDVSDSNTKVFLSDANGNVLWVSWLGWWCRQGMPCPDNGHQFLSSNFLL